MTLTRRRAALSGSALLALAAGMPLAAFGQKKIVLGFSQIGAESEWRTANTESIKQAAKDAGIELKFADAQQKQENQIKAIRSFIAQKVDVIAFSPVVESGWGTVLREAKAAKIPVIFPTVRSTRRTTRCGSRSWAPTSSKKGARPAAGWWTTRRTARK